jgi:hypothetical protein
VDRRRFLGTLAGGLVAAPLAAEAQQAGKVARIGYLVTGSLKEKARTAIALRRPTKVRVGTASPRAA